MTKQTSSPVSHAAYQFLILVLFVSSFVVTGCRTETRQQESAPSQKGAILGGSMAPNLLGEHFDCHCADCSMEFQFDAATAPKQFAVCPNCGFAENSKEDWNRKPADRVRVEADGQDVDFQRFDVVAFHHPERKGEFAVKRILGLPDEQFEIRNGDIFADGGLIRKDLNQQQQNAILVYDHRHVPTDNRVMRWSTNHEFTAWKQTTAGFTFDDSMLTGSSNTDDAGERLSYHHIRGYLGSAPAISPDEVRDFYAYNQTTVRALNRVRDLAVRFQLNAAGPTSLRIEFTHLEPEVWVEISIENNEEQSGNHRLVVRVNSGPTEVAQQTIPIQTPASTDIFVSVFDEQVLVAANSETLIRKELPNPLSPKRTTSPFCLIAECGEVTVSGLQLFRDIFYLRPGNETDPWTAFGNGYVLLGDNVPVSIDSRRWEPSRLQRVDLIGRAVKESVQAR